MKPTTAYKLQSISYKHISLLLHVHVSAILVAIFREVSTKDYRKFQNHCKHKMKFHIYGLKYVLKYKINVFYFRMVTYHTILSTVLYILIYRGADKSLARPGKKQARKHVRDARDFNNIERPAVIKFPPPPPPLQGKAPMQIYAILTEILACFLPGWAKDLSAPLHILNHTF